MHACCQERGVRVERTHWSPLALCFKHLCVQQQYPQHSAVTTATPQLLPQPRRIIASMHHKLSFLRNPRFPLPPAVKALQVRHTPSCPCFAARMIIPSLNHDPSEVSAVVWAAMPSQHPPFPNHYDFAGKSSVDAAFQCILLLMFAFWPQEQFQPTATWSVGGGEGAWDGDEEGSPRWVGAGHHTAVPTMHSASQLD